MAVKKNNRKEKTIEWVDVHDDALMVELGIHLPNVEPRDPAIWTKTIEEKELLRKLRSRHKEHLTGGNMNPVSIPVYGKLIVTIKPSKEYTAINKNHECIKKTTWSFNCGQSDIRRILNKFGNLVIKYKWLGKEYSPGQFPFWYGKKR